jgi:hypothetical protein
MKTLKASLWCVAASALFASSAGCFGEVSWSNHISFRSYGRGLHLSHVDPEELLVGRISRKLHYVSLSLDAVFFRDLPGLFQRDVVFGFEIRGAGPKAIKTVLEVTEAAGEHSFLSFDNAAVLQPFLYDGRNMEITLWFKSTAKDQVGNIKGRLSGAGDALKKLNPLADQAIGLANNIFEGVIGAFVQKEQSWKYTFTLYPADSTYRDKPELLFTAGRHILLSMPPANAPKQYRFLKPANLIKYLGMRGNRLIWNHSEEEFNELPYIILNITRYKRYPTEDTPLRKMVTEVVKAYETGNLDMARGNLKNVRGLIFEDKVITQREKNLEQLWTEFREAQIDTAQAEKDGNKEKQLDGYLQQLKFLFDILRGFPEILEPFEIKNIDFMVSRLVASYERLAQIAGKNTEDLNKLVETRRSDAEMAKKKARDEEVARQRLMAKHDVRMRSKVKPPKDVMDAIASLRTAIMRPWRKWWFWAIVGGAVLGGAAYPTMQVLGGSSQAIKPDPGGLTLGGGPGARPAAQ